MSKRVSQEQFARMEKMLIEYSNAYAGIYSICGKLTQKLSELEERLNQLESSSPQQSTEFEILGK